MAAQFSIKVTIQLLLVAGVSFSVNLEGKTRLDLFALGLKNISRILDFTLKLHIFSGNMYNIHKHIHTTGPWQYQQIGYF